MKVLINIIYSLLWLLSLLPLRFLYILSDIIFLIMFIFPPLRYRKKVVRKNLSASFPGYTKKDLRRIERQFYHRFFDTIFESLKSCSASERWMKRHFHFDGLEVIMRELEQGHSIVTYLGHVGNWEWMASAPLYIKPPYLVCEVYHPLENPIMDGVIKKIRERFGSVSIPMDLIFKRLVRYKNEGKAVLVGMIADQVPLYDNIHFWTNFLNQKTPVFTGSERIIKKLGLVALYGEMQRVRRGYYCLKMELISNQVNDEPQFKITEDYFKLLEKTIIADPASWLWSHNRWKRTWERYLEHLKDKENKRIERSKIIESKQ